MHSTPLTVSLRNSNILPFSNKLLKTHCFSLTFKRLDISNGILLGEMVEEIAATLIDANYVCGRHSIRIVVRISRIQITDKYWGDAHSEGRCASLVFCREACRFLASIFLIYLTFTQYESRHMLGNSYASCAHHKYYFLSPKKLWCVSTSSGAYVRGAPQYSF